jgi:hypothetical protein
LISGARFEKEPKSNSVEPDAEPVAATEGNTMASTSGGAVGFGTPVVKVHFADLPVI